MHHLGKLLIHAAGKWPDHPFAIGYEAGGWQHHTFGAFHGQVLALAAFLRERGVGKGDRVAFVLPKSVPQLRAFFACWHLGIIAVPVCEGLGDPEMQFVFADAEPALILADDSCAALARRNGGGVPVVLFDELPPVPAAAPPAVVEVAHDAVAALIYTSGSTGCPKGVMLTHRNLYRNAESTLAAVPLRPGGEMLLSLLPYWHSYALVVEVVVAAMAGLVVVIPKDKRDFLPALRRFRPTVVLLVPRIADLLRAGMLKAVGASVPAAQALFRQALHNASRIFTHGPQLNGGLLRILTHRTIFDPLVFRRLRATFGGRLRFFISGGAPLDLENQVFFKHIGLPIHQGYGLSETSPVISINLDDAHWLGSCGRLLSWLHPAEGGDYTFLADDGVTLGKRVRGELLVKGDCVMKGYWRHADASAKTIRDGWLHTGDMGHLDHDGYLHIHGRRSNLIVLAGGEKLHPEPVEEAISSDQLFRDVMVIGDHCQSVYACASLDDAELAAIPAAQRPAVIRRRLREATAHLAPFQRPKDVLVIPPLKLEDGTVTATLKVRRFGVWKQHGDAIRAFLAKNGERLPEAHPAAPG
ncbi:MAG: AMP-binding protein [Lentisphaeria bacterium]